MSTEADETWNVIALGFDSPDTEAVAGLQRVFGIDAVTAERVVRSTPRAVKHDVTREVALWYGAALAGIGGRYELQPSADAFSQTSAGEHVSPVVSASGRPVASSSAPPAWLAGSSEFAAPAARHQSLGSGLEIDTSRSDRPMALGNHDPRGRSIEVARASMSTPPPGASQSLPPPRRAYSAGASTPPPAASKPSAAGERTLLGVGVAMLAVGLILGRLRTPLLWLAPVLMAVGVLLAVRGAWKLYSK